MIRLQLLGQLEVTDNSGAPVGSVVTQSRRVALLAYLAAAEPHGFHRRDKLLALFWPEYDEVRARSALRKALHFLRHELGPVIVNRGDQEIGIDPEQLQCDARELVEKLDQGDVENALPLYQGDLLDGFFISEAPEFHNWLDEARAQLRQRAIRAALQLADARAKRRESSAAKSWSGWATSHAPYDEGVLRHRLEILTVLGDRAGALKIYQEFADRLLSDLEVEPSPETEAYVEQLRHGKPVSSSGEAAATDHETPLSPAPSAAIEPAPTAPHPSRSRLVAGVGLAAAAAIAVIATGWLIATRDRTRAPAVVPEPRQVTFDGDIIEATMSQDGRFVAYITQRSSEHVLSVLEIGVGTPTDLWAVDPLLIAPQWSPDGERLLVRTMDGTYMLPRTGIAAPQLMNAWNVSAWTPDGSHIYSWWPQAKYIGITDVATNDTASVVLTTDHDWLEGASWSPTEARIAFITLKGTGPSSLFVMAADGTALQLVHQDSVIIFSPQWSPEGNAIYYLRRGPSDELWKVQVASDGTPRGPPVRLLSGLSLNVRNQAVPTFTMSQDGRSLLYTRRSGFANLWLFRPDRSGGTPQQLSTGTSAVRTPRLSPSGERIVFADSVAGRSRLFVVALQGGPVEELAFAETFVRHPAWSPDGGQVAYATVRGSGEALIRTVDVDAGLHRDIELDEVAGGDWLAWAPSASLIYLHATDRNFGVVDPETGDERPLLTDTLNWMYEPRPSTDGSLLAVFMDLPGTDPSGIWIIDVTHGDAVPLQEEMVPIGWSADDSMVYAMRETDRRQGGTREIFAVPRSGGEPVLFFTLPLAAEPWNVDIARDGSLIVAALNEFQTDAWIIDNFDPERSGGG